MFRKIILIIVFQTFLINQVVANIEIKARSAILQDFLSGVNFCTNKMLIFQFIQLQCTKNYDEHYCF